MTAEPPLDPLGLMLQMSHNINKKSNGIYALCIATISLLIDAKVVTSRQVVQRLKGFFDALSEDRKTGGEGIILKAAIEMVEASENGFRPKVVLEVIEGGLSPEYQD